MSGKEREARGSAGAGGDGASRRAVKCAEARARMLEAAPAELDHAADTPLAEHLRACPECRAAADRVLEANALLDGVLAAAPKRPVDEVVARLRRAGAPPRRPASVPLESGPRRISRPWRLSVGVGLAAAAVVAALLIRSEPTTPTGGGGTGAVGPPSAAGPVAAGTGQSGADPVGGPVPLVEDAGGDAFAVFATSNPDVTVVWIYEEGA